MDLNEWDFLSTDNANGKVDGPAQMEFHIDGPTRIDLRNSLSMNQR